MRLDTMPVSGGVNKEDLETAKQTVLKNWRISKSAEKKERIGEALDKLIDIVSPPEVIAEPVTEIEIDLEAGEEVKVTRTKVRKTKPDNKK